MMRNWTAGLLMLVISAGVLAADAAPPKTESPSPEKIKVLIQALGSEDFTTRKAAEKELARAGQPALEPLQAALKSTDPEVRAAAERLVPRLKLQTAEA